jgi:hypothetical protein
MQEAASQGRAQGKISPIVAGLGAAFVAGAITLTIMMSGSSPVAVSGQSATASSDQCQMIHRKLLVSTTTGSGTIRLRAGSYLSPPIALGTGAQGVVFPLPRPQNTPVEEVITIEGNASDVVITSEVSEYRRVIPSVIGVSAFPVSWKPMKGC